MSSFRIDLQSFGRILFGEKIPFLVFCFTLLLMLLSVPAFGGATCSNFSAAANATSWSRWECNLDVQGVGTTLAGRNPFLTKIKVTYTASGQPTRTGYAFWDGVVNVSQNIHRFRMRMHFPPAANPTTWTWTTACETSAYCSSDTSKTNPSLVSSGTVTVNRYSGTNPLYGGGPIRIVSSFPFYPVPELYQGNNRFNWIGDSAWAAPLRASAAEWDAYLDNRRSSTNPAGPASANATIIQIGPAPEWADLKDAQHPGFGDFNNNPPFDQIGCTSTAVQPNSCTVPNLAFWRAFEEKIDRANQKGLYIFLAGMMEPYKRYPAADQAVLFANWLAARLSGNFVIFSPGFDSPPPNNTVVDLIKAVGAGLKATAPHHLITNHWSTNSDLAVTKQQMAGIHTEPWFSFALYQSGFMNGSEPQIAYRARTLAQILAGHTVEAPFNTNRKPTVNGEAVYDEGGATNGRPAFRAYRARQAGYLSWLSGSMGYTHGSGGLWDWGACAGPTPNPCNNQMPLGYRNYNDAMQASGQAFKNVKYFGEALRRSNTDEIISREQWRVMAQPTDETKKMAVARSRDWMAAYLPHNQTIQLRYVVAGTGGSASINAATARLWNPATGTFESNAPARNCPVNQDYCTFTNGAYNSNNPDASDRLLVLTPGSANTWSLTSTSSLHTFVGRFTADERLAVYGQEVDGTGEPLGGVWLIHRPTVAEPSAEPFSPAAGRDGNGKYLVVWSADVDGDGQREIWGKWVFPGNLGRQVAFRISPEDGSEHFEPSVAISGQGIATVAWTRASWPIHGNEIWARTVSVPNDLGEPEAICEGMGKSCRASKTVASLAGTVSIGWIESDESAEGYGMERVMIRSFSDNDLGDPAAAEQQINLGESPRFLLANLHIDANGEVKAEYEGLLEGASNGIYTRSYDAAGVPVGSELLVELPQVDTY